MKILIKFTGIILLSLILNSGIAQTTSINNLYYNNMILVNPAYAGSEGVPTFYLDTRNQWARFDGAPQTVDFGIHAPLGNQMGLGAMFSSDNRGLQRTFSGSLVYSYKVMFDTKNNLTFGINAGFDSHTIDRSKISVQQDPDQISDALKMADAYENMTLAAGFGMRYSWNDALDINLSMPQLFESNYDWKKDILASVSYKFKAMEDHLTLEPIILMRTLTYVPMQFDFSLVGDVNHTFWLSAGYRTSQSYILSFGVYVKDLTIGYAYEGYTGNVALLNASTYEFVVRWKIPHEVKKQVTDDNSCPPFTKTDEDLKRDLEFNKKLSQIRGDLNSYNKTRDSMMEAYRTDSVLVMSKGIAHGNYVVIHTFQDWNTVPPVVEKMRKNDIKGIVIYNKTKKSYYIYSDMYAKLEDGLKRMEKLRKKSFDSWVLVY